MIIHKHLAFSYNFVVWWMALTVRTAWCSGGNYFVIITHHVLTMRSYCCLLQWTYDTLTARFLQYASFKAIKSLFTKFQSDVPGLNIIQYTLSRNFWLFKSTRFTIKFVNEIGISSTRCPFCNVIYIRKQVGDRIFIFYENSIDLCGIKRLRSEGLLS